MSDFDAPYDNYVRELEKARVSSSPSKQVGIVRDIDSNGSLKIELSDGTIVDSANEDSFVTIRGHKVFVGSQAKVYTYTGKEWEDKLNNLDKINKFLVDSYLDTCLSKHKIKKVFMDYVDKKM